MKPLAAVVADFDAIADAIARERCPDRLSPAERFVLRQVPSNARRGLDVGCGDGALTRSLAARGIAMTGIDASPGMIALARARKSGIARVEYRVADITAGLPKPSEYDVVVSVAVVHHAPLSRIVEALQAAVAPGGTLIIQDIVSRTGIRNMPVNALAWALRRGRRLLERERRRTSVEELYEIHGAGEEYLEPSEVASAYRDLLPGASIHHHLEWRYTVVWNRPAGGA